MIRKKSAADVRHRAGTATGTPSNQTGSATVVVAPELTIALRRYMKGDDALSKLVARLARAAAAFPQTQYDVSEKADRERTRANHHSCHALTGVKLAADLQSWLEGSFQGLMPEAGKRGYVYLGAPGARSSMADLLRRPQTDNQEDWTFRGFHESLDQFTRQTKEWARRATEEGKKPRGRNAGIRRYLGLYVAESLMSYGLKLTKTRNGLLPTVLYEVYRAALAPQPPPTDLDRESEILIDYLRGTGPLYPRKTAPKNR